MVAKIKTAIWWAEGVRGALVALGDPDSMQALVAVDEAIAALHRTLEAVKAQRDRRRASFRAKATGGETNAEAQR